MSADSKFDFSQVPKFAPIVKNKAKATINETENELSVSSKLTDSSELEDKPSVTIFSSNQDLRTDAQLNRSMKKINSEVALRSSSDNKKVIVNLTQIDENDYGEEKLMHSHSNPVIFDIKRIVKQGQDKKKKFTQDD